MSETLVSIVDPSVACITRTDGHWFVFDVPADVLAEISDPTRAVDGDVLSQRARGGSLVFVPSAEGTVRIWRGALAAHDVFFAWRPDRGLVISDHILNVIAELPQRLRRPGGPGLVEHYVCTHVYDRRTFVERIQRPGMGDRVTIDTATGSATFEVVEPLHQISYDDAETDVVERVERAIDAIITPLSGEDRVACTFSGGVDSTLLASFTGPDTPLLMLKPDTPEFAIETEYATRAAGLLGRSLAEREVRETEFMTLLERRIDRAGNPHGHYVSPVLADLFEFDADVFILGEGADSVFGTDRGLRRISGAFANRTGLAALDAASHLPGSTGRRARQVRSYAREYAEPTTSMSGAFAGALAYGDDALARRVFGDDAVDEVYGLQMDAVVSHIDLESSQSDRFHQHLESVMWRWTYGDLNSSFRATALATGKRAVSPYTEASVVDALRTVPADRRYVKKLAGKWVLKEILERRVPGYPINQRKNATAIPFHRYYTDGPLVGVWSELDVPDLFTGSMRSELVDRPSSMTWNAITHAVWSDRIETNPDLQPLASSTATTIVHTPVGGGPA
ncbi:MAG: hypothetical protein KDB69_08320 [Acidimicrobiia bacterium]|nr:hypothetical protein [Acidimicrobiia bacterium]